MLGQFFEVIGIDGNAVYARLDDNRRCHLKHIAGITLMTALVVAAHVMVHHHTAPVGCCHRIAGEGVHGQFETFLFGMVLREEYIL